MKIQETAIDRKQELVVLCLDKFIEKGLYETSVKDLGDAVNLNPGALYFHFANKDEIVLACAEEAGIRMESILILPVLDCLDDTNRYIEMAAEHMSVIEPMMRFFTQVCTTKKYREAIQPVLDRMKKRHQDYSERFARELHCGTDEIAPYLYACVALVANYMIFGEDFYYKQPFQIVSDAILAIKNRQK